MEKSTRAMISVSVTGLHLKRRQNSNKFTLFVHKCGGGALFLEADVLMIKSDNSALPRRCSFYSIHNNFLSLKRYFD